MNGPTDGRNVWTAGETLKKHIWSNSTTASCSQPMNFSAHPCMYMYVYTCIHVCTLVLAYRTELPSRYSADKGFSRTGAESEFQEKLGCELGKNSADKGFPRTGAESEFQEKLGCELGKKLRNPYESWDLRERKKLWQNNNLTVKAHAASRLRNSPIGRSLRAQIVKQKQKNSAHATSGLLDHVRCGLCHGFIKEKGWVGGFDWAPKSGG